MAKLVIGSMFGFHYKFVLGRLFLSQCVVAMAASITSPLPYNQYNIPNRSNTSLLVNLFNNSNFDYIITI